jgi:ABC-2 type transport system ATP-binding protein
VGHPPLLVLDEPTTGLDPAARLVMWSILRRAVAGGASVILSTHSLEEAERVSDRVGIISAGRLLTCGTLKELTARAPLEDIYFELVGQRGPGQDADGEER